MLTIVMTIAAIVWMAVFVYAMKNELREYYLKARRAYAIGDRRQ